MGSPKHYCAECGGKMVYDKILSEKHKHTVWWCLHCNIVEYYKKLKVHNSVNSIRRFIFRGMLP